MKQKSNKKISQFIFIRYNFRGFLLAVVVVCGFDGDARIGAVYNGRYISPLFLMCVMGTQREKGLISLAGCTDYVKVLQGETHGEREKERNCVYKT